MSTFNIAGIDEQLFSKLETIIPSGVIASPEDPSTVFNEIAPIWMFEEKLKLRYWRENWIEWRTTHWEIITENDVRAKLYEILSNLAYRTGKGELRRWAPTKGKINNILDVMRAKLLLSDKVELNTWLNDFETDEKFVSCKNLLVNVKSGETMPHNIDYFNTVSLPFNYDVGAPEPNEWLNFLDTLWNDSPNSILALQEWFGYIISGMTKFQKGLYLHGPKRSGKGTIGKLLMALVGTENSAGPTINSLTTNFGLAPLIGKSLAVVDDARWTNIRNISEVVERLLTLISNGYITVDVKYKPLQQCRLDARFLIMSNDLPNVKEVSDAFIRRFIYLETTKSWFDKEDIDLEEKLKKELPGIFNWALIGLTRLLENGKFTIPERMAASIMEISCQASPVSAFINQLYDVGGYNEIPFRDVYALYCKWSLDNNIRKLSTVQFSRQLKVAYSGQVSSARHKINGSQVLTLIGLRLL